ncbi:MAG TPA: VTT domain-containing protein, partial [Oxalicibacterium sp.]|nr:VTT domain-containing protein [Oxalicibacterium sp.]
MSDRDSEPQSREQFAPADASSANHGLLRPGHNCWQIAQARRFSLLIDAQAYFSAVRQAMCNARHSIFILSWDIDSRVRLVPEGANDGWPQALGEFLAALVKARPELHVYVLNWDFAMLYALERELPPAYGNGWQTQRRLMVQMDGHHPVGASHHQKVVVIDDALAFVGGLDLTRSRWDTPEHACDNPLRRDADGKPYAPFHDVQALVDSDAAAALGELARKRWRDATGRRAVAAARNSSHDPWPESVQTDISNLRIGIARTQPAFENDSGIFEIRQLYLDAITSARRLLFFENQYFTSDLISGALAERLNDADAPEVAIVSPEMQSGWLEQATMGVLRARVHARLKEADAKARYRMYCPQLPGLGADCLNVHSKVFAVDDELFCVGSANMSNRSLVLDTECNLVIDARTGEDDADCARIRSAIAQMRNRLLAEHQDTQPQAVAAVLERNGSLHATIAALKRDKRWMIEFDPIAIPSADALIPANAVFDPERPINPDELIAQLVPKDARKPIPRRLVGLGMFALALAICALAWRFTPLGKWINLGSLIAVAQSIDDMPFTPLIVIAFYTLAGLIIPITLLIAVTGIVFGPLYGALYAIVGSVATAVFTYLLGRWIGRDTVRRYLGARVNRLSRRIAKRGILAMAIIRILPIAPFTVVNVIAGASHIG